MPQADFVPSVNLNENTDFPYLVLHIAGDHNYPRNAGFEVLHWHRDLQFTYVLEGETEVQTLQQRLTLHAGEAVFINRDVVHLVKKHGACRYNSFIFPERFLRFYSGCPAAALVDSLVGNPELPIAPLPLTPQYAASLQLLRQLTELEAQPHSDTYSYEVLTLLSALWLSFYRTITLPAAPAAGAAITTRRMDLFLRYIEQHYSEDLTLEMLARSANVSVSECLRCFKATLQTTPFQYLSQYRLSRAASLLRHTTLPIGEIAEQVGFQQVSYFGKCFRQKTGYSPSRYRQAGVLSPAIEPPDPQ